MFKPPAVRPRFASDLTVVNEIKGRPNTTAPAGVYQPTAPAVPPAGVSEEESEDEWTISRIMYEKPSKKIVRQFFKDRVRELEEQNEEF